MFSNSPVNTERSDPIAPPPDSSPDPVASSSIVSPEDIEMNRFVTAPSLTIPIFSVAIFSTRRMSFFCSSLNARSSRSA